MGVAHSNLPTIATLALEMSILPLMLAMWCHQTHNFLGWGTVALIIGWSIAVREAYGVNSPLTVLAGQDLIDAQLIYNGIYVIMAVLFAMLGTFVGTILDLPGLLPFHACIYGNRSPEHKLVRWGRKCNPPYRHTIITFILFLFAIVAPFVSYSLLMDNYRGWALGVSIVVPVITYIVCFLYWWWDTSLYVFGPTDRNTKRGSKYRRVAFNNGGFRAENDGDATTSPDPSVDPNDQTEETDENNGDEDPASESVVVTTATGNVTTKGLSREEVGATRFRIIKTVLILAVTQVICTMVLGFIRFSDPNVDVSWIAAAIIGGVILLIAIIIAIIFFFVARRSVRSTGGMVCENPDYVLGSNSNRFMNAIPSFFHASKNLEKIF